VAFGIAVSKSEETTPRSPERTVTKRTRALTPFRGPHGPVADKRVKLAKSGAGGF